MPQCTGAGLHKAPKSVYALQEYYWFCLDHAREYNRHWDYFSGLKQDQIEAFMKDAVTGHRPTWKREEHFTFTPDMLADALNEFLNGRTRTKPAAHAPHLSRKEREALAVLELDAPCSLAALKTHYRGLVKRFHPDRHPGKPQVEERFKRITAAYAYLQARYADR